MAPSGPFVIRRTYIVVVFLVTAFAATFSCRPKPIAGALCRVADQLLCAGGDRAIVCRSGAWNEVPCHGPSGCTRRGDVDDCDDTVASLGDACPSNPPLDYACTADRRSALACRDGKFGLWRNCRGLGGCSVAGGRHLDCDTTQGQAGDPCEKPGTYACSADGQQMLICNGQSLVVATSCRGPQGCRFDRDRHTIDCDDAVALEGDPCERPNRITCGIDRKSELVCEANQYAKKRECRRTDCRIESNELFCD